MWVDSVQPYCITCSVAGTFHTVLYNRGDFDEKQTHES